MRLIYFDEVKYHPSTQPRHWIGALSIESQQVAEIEGRLNTASEKLFGTKRLSRETEFHAVDMVHGKAQFKGRSIEDRLSALEEIFAIASMDGIRRISVSVLPEKMIVPNSASEKAFVFFVERAELDLAKSKDNGILIGDLDTEYADEGVSNLSLFRDKGTPYHFGKSIDRILDSVYFIPSHHSRLIQLADAYAYALQLMSSPPDGDNYPKTRIRKFLKEKTQLGWANSYKDWPTDDSWATQKRAA